MNRPVIVQDVLATLKNCRGYYKYPKGEDGKRLGPLVGYAGTYDATHGEKKHFVGEVYYNFAMAEQWPHVLQNFAERLGRIMRDCPEVSIVLGAPMGGIRLAGALGTSLDCRVIFAEKKVTQAVTGGEREKSVLVVDRHEISEGDRVALIEDICNNFSTTEQLVDLVTNKGGRVTAIVCAINRSPFAEYTMHHPLLPVVPVVSLVHVPTQQWKQEDPEVREDVARGNVVWKAKPNWPMLEAAMAQHSSRSS